MEQLLARGILFEGDEMKPSSFEGGRLPRMTQEEFEETGSLIMSSVQQIMKEQYGFEELEIIVSGAPLSQPDIAKVWVSPDFLTNQDKCLILLQGNGPALPGVWARSQVVNDSLDMGSMLP